MSMEQKMERALAGAKVADALADSAADGPGAARRAARMFSTADLHAGAAFLGSVLVVAAVSADAIASTLEARRDGDEGEGA